MKDKRDTSCPSRHALDVPRFKGGVWQKLSDPVTVEEEFTVTWECPGAPEGSPLSGSVSLWAWPEDLPPLALGHILLDVCPSSSCLHRQASAKSEDDGRSWHVTIGDELEGTLPEPPAAWRAEELFPAMHDFISAGGRWDSTGCFHRAGVYDVAAKTLLTRSEDIGRHNCVDRLAGWSVHNNIPLSDKALLISARMTSSLCAKAIRAGFRLIVSRSAVTTAAIGMMEAVQGTLIGFARTNEQRFTVFCDPLNRLNIPAL